jgi:hypothetical protein
MITGRANWYTLLSFYFMCFDPIILSPFTEKCYIIAV